MTIEIKELVIKASVGKASNNTTEDDSGEGRVDQQKIVRACVEQVLEILKREKER